MQNFINKYKPKLTKLLKLPYLVGSTIALSGIWWVLLGYWVSQYFIDQEAFVLFAVTGLLWMVGNGPFITSDFNIWKKHLWSAILFFGLYFIGLYWLTQNLQTMDVYNAQLLGQKLMLLGLGNFLIGASEIIFRFYTSSAQNKTRT